MKIVNLKFLLLVVLLFSFRSISAQCAHPDDYKALRALYLATNGDHWTKNTGWPDRTFFENNATLPSGVKLNLWHGISCNGNRVVEIDLSNNNLLGSIPDLQIQFLQKINLAENRLSGTIPTLTTSQLQVLDLSKNKLSGALPVLKFLNLKILNLSENNFTGSLPLFDLSNIEIINLEKNELSGSIPKFSYAKLRYLELGHNKLSGAIPSLSLPSLEFFSIKNNRISGNIPGFAFEFNKLWTLHFENNFLNGCIPPNFIKFCDSLEIQEYQGIPNNNVMVYPSINLSGNPLLPWQGDFSQFCGTNGTIQAQRSAPCHNGNISDGPNDVIQNNCNCGLQPPCFLTDIEISYSGSQFDFSVCTLQDFELNAISLSGKAPLSYNWTGPNGLVSTNQNLKIFQAKDATHSGAYLVTVTDANGCTGTDDINVNVIPLPSNNSCGTAKYLGTGISTIHFKGTTSCGSAGGPCANPNNNNAVYFTYLVPQEGLPMLEVSVPGFYISIGTTCGNGSCKLNKATIECPDPGTTVFITISSSENTSGNFNGKIIPTLKPSQIDGKVFQDFNTNGIFDIGDNPIVNISILAYPDCDRTKTALETKTDNQGNYLFSSTLLNASSDYLITINSQSIHNCFNGVAECVSIDPCNANSTSILFPCTTMDCPENEFSHDNICEDAFSNPVCDLRDLENVSCFINPSEMGPWSGAPHCNGVYQNTTFIGFVAGSGNYDIEIDILQCNGPGVQYGLMETCNPYGPFIVCDGAPTRIGQKINISSNFLRPCKTHILWVDSYADKVCSFKINIMGDYVPCKAPDINEIRIELPCTSLCPSLNPLTLTAVPELNSDLPIEQLTSVEYKWTVSDQEGTVTYSKSGPDGLNIKHTFIDEGTYTVCLSTYHPCSGDSPVFCKTFTFENIKDDYREFKICNTDFPWSGAFDNNNKPLLDKHGNQWAWFGGNITLQMVKNGLFNFTSLYENECGCTYNQSFRISTTTLCAKDNATLEIDSTNFPTDSITSEILEDAKPSLSHDWRKTNYQVFPNPTNGIVFITPNQPTEFKVDVYSMSGLPLETLLVESKTQGIGFQLSLDQFPQAMYLIRILDDDGFSYHRVMKY